MRRYRLAAYLRIDPEENEFIGGYEEIRAEQEQQETLFPENIYVMEEIMDESDREGAGRAGEAPGEF